jgi:hypothetical protein
MIGEAILFPLKMVMKSQQLSVAKELNTALTACPAVLGQMV